MGLITEFNEFLNSDLLLEYLTPKEIHNKYYSDIPEKVFTAMVLVDPTTVNNRTSTDMNTLNRMKKIGQYVKWMCRNYKAGRLKSEDIYKLEKYLETYHNLKQKGLLDKLEIEKDINKFKSHQELYSVIEDYIDVEDDEDLMSNTSLMKKIKEEESKKVFEDDKWIIRVPLTHRAACYYGKHTQWCTAAKDDESMFDEYNDEGNIYININKTNNRKYQFHFESMQFMDEKDDDINFTSFFLNNPTLEKFYNENDDIVTTITNKLPSGVTIIKDAHINYMVFNEWSNFSELFVDIDNNDYVSNILSGNSVDFVGHGMRYEYYGDVNTETMMKMIEFVQKYIKDNNITEFVDEYDLDYLLNKCDDLKEIYDFCNYNEYSVITDAINSAYLIADESANFSLAYEEMKDAIIDKFNLGKDVKYDNDKEHYKTNMGSILNLFNTYYSSPVSIEYDIPSYGYSGDIKDDDLSEEIMQQLGAI